MTQRLEIIGKTYGRLTVEKYVSSNGYGQAVWHCRCACGGSKDVLGYLLKRGEVKSCGCLKGKQNRNKDAQIVRAEKTEIMTDPHAQNEMEVAYK